MAQILCSFPVLKSFWEVWLESLKRGAPWADKYELLPLDEGDFVLFTWIDPGVPDDFTPVTQKLNNIHVI